MDKTIIAGPCSEESREQLRETTEALAKTAQVSLIRAGVWKPRTRPGNFEGLGEPALQWMQELAAEYGVRYCCEVAHPEHVALCQQYGIQTVWLGARTTGNPFMVEEICNALRGSGMSVLVKNPMIPDVHLWLGAIERLQAAGIANLTAVHRGFAMYNNHGYRNAPLWEVPLELRRERPDLPLLCDPSHIGGRADLVAPIALAAMQLGYDGLMVEVHPHPEAAQSDPEQQITPDKLTQLIENLTIAHRTADNGQLAAALAPLRQQIDDIDHELLGLLARRMKLSQQIASVKQEMQTTVYQPKRWEQVLQDRLQIATALGLNADFTKELLEKIHAESVRVQLG
ncbi:MAG: bifunctional 3-deoxy-7-phosphoheptulonate synthase/chorismate mutase type II [Bacteroidales bacterium]|nr:bifunctional 3-deoxy-7-phosphoheptulonate synthase/chorismate mutase type II [Bacteroidales bacterium]